MWCFLLVNQDHDTKIDKDEHNILLSVLQVIIFEVFFFNFLIKAHHLTKLRKLPFLKIIKLYIKSRLT